MIAKQNQISKTMSLKENNKRLQNRHGERLFLVKIRKVSNSFWETCCDDAFNTDVRLRHFSFNFKRSTICTCLNKRSYFIIIRHFKSYVRHIQRPNKSKPSVSKTLLKYNFYTWEIIVNDLESNSEWAIICPRWYKVLRTQKKTLYLQSRIFHPC